MYLPASFEMNSFERMVQFLNESNRIEAITEIDYSQKKYQTLDKGHFGALIQSQQSALNHEPLTIGKIKQWQSLLTREQLAFNHSIGENEIGHIRGPSLQKNVRVGSHIPPDWEKVPTLLDYLIEQINEGLKDSEKLKNDAEYCNFLARSFQQFESIHPFADGNGRVGRLIANYIATFCQRPAIVFKSEMIERNEYYRAHKSPKTMARFMAMKIQEAIFGSIVSDGGLLFKVEDLSGATCRYESGDRKCREQYEWHSLNPILLEEEGENEKPSKDS